LRKERNGKKFGECSSAPPGPEKGITSVGDEVFMDLVKGQKSTENKLKKHDPSATLGIICRNCGKTGDHWTLKCPYKDKLSAPGLQPTLENSIQVPTETKDGKYIPPWARIGAKPTGSLESSDRRQRDETATIRVTNLSEDTKESDLNELFRSFGPISRIYLAKDKSTNLSKGFAFVNFVYLEDAAKAIEKLSGFGYDHLILHLEWAKPSNK